MDLEYKAGLVSRPFRFLEFKKTINLLLDGRSREEIKDLALVDNIYGLAKDYRKLEVYNTMKSRIQGLDGEVLEIFSSTDLSNQKLINLLSILEDDLLFFEFIYQVYRGKILEGEERLKRTDARKFLEDKALEDEKVAGRREVTIKRLSSAYMNILTEAGLLRPEEKTYIINPALPDYRLASYLEESGRGSILKAIRGER